MEKGSSPNYPARVIKFLQGNGDVVAVDIKQKGKDKWIELKESWGAVWRIDTHDKLIDPSPATTPPRAAPRPSPRTSSPRAGSLTPPTRPSEEDEDMHFFRPTAHQYIFVLPANRRE
uniref:Uncharacterized protein n=1 Tax=Aegilops tauschii TaxID=37682 RepID=R7WD99_AEGTA